MKHVILISMIIAASVFARKAQIAPKSEADQPSYSITTNDQRPRYALDEILVKFKNNIEETITARVVQQLQGEVFYTSPYWGFKRIRIPEDKTVEEMVALYSARPDIVEYAEPNGYLYPNWTPNDPYFSFQWHFDASHLNMPAAWNIEQGGNSSVIVGILDTGIAYENYPIPAHEQSEVISGDGNYHKAPDLNNTTFVSGYDTFNNDPHPNDEHGHGTHVCGTVAQSTNNGIGVAGMAFKCSIMPVRVLGLQGGSTASISDGIGYAVQHGAKVLNMSLGGDPGDSTGQHTEHLAIIDATNKGVVIVASTGNNNAGMIGYPAAFPECIAVGATDYLNQRAPYSNWGQGIDVVAPGGDISADRNNDGYADGVVQQTYVHPGNGDPAQVDAFDYLFWNGTSMAAPHVTGLVALLIAHGVTGVDNIKNRIYSTCKDLGASGYDQTYGYGLIQPEAALKGGGGGTETELKYDENSVFYVVSDEIDNAYAVQFTPTQYPFKVKKIGLYVSSNGNPTTPFDLFVIPEGASAISIPGVHATTPDAFNWFDVSNRNIIIESGDFYAGIQYKTPSNPKIGTDVAPPLHHRSWNYWNGDWYNFDDFDSPWSDSMDLMIRAQGIAGYGIEEEVATTESDFQLTSQPNPFRYCTHLAFQVPVLGRVSVKVYDASGRLVRMLVDEVKTPGSYTITWDGKNDNGNRVSQGIYFYHLTTSKSTLIQKVVLLH